MRYALLVSICLLVLCGSVNATDTTIRPSANDGGTSGGPGSGSLYYPDKAYDGNLLTSTNLAVSHAWTHGAGLTYRTITFLQFPAGYTPVSMKMRYSGYADGRTECAARFKAEYYDGSWRDWFIHEDNSSAPAIQVQPTWTDPLYFVGVAGSEVVKVRVTVEAERTSVGCGFGGADANMQVIEIEMTASDCARPINFTQTNGWDSGGGLIQFNYSFQSSTGRLTDLSQCQLLEELDYNPSPHASPPFPVGFGSPSHQEPVPPIDTDLTDGSATDAHWPPTVVGPWVTPYAAASGTVDQRYLFTCPCYSGGSRTPVGGPYTITRSVSQNADATWRYTVSKNGVTSVLTPLP